MENDNCICCGAYVPEGRQVCNSCLPDNSQQCMTEEEAEMIRWLASASDKDIMKAMRMTDKELFGHALA